MLSLEQRPSQQQPSPIDLMRLVDTVDAKYGTDLVRETLIAADEFVEAMRV